MESRTKRLLARNLRRARRRRRVSQQELAARSGVPAGAIGSFELQRSFPSAEKIDRLAAALGMEPFQLFLDEKDASTDDKYASMVTLADELRSRIDGTIADTLKRHLQ